jgi:3-carboxy-cis,cis-muconate cycloisomerase
MDERPDFDAGFSTREMSRVWSAEHQVRRLCEVEAALANACATAGRIPVESAAAIAAACRQNVPEPARLLAAGFVAGSPVIPLIEHLRSKLPAIHAAFVHHGATSQDIIDSGAVLQTRDALLVLRSFALSLSDGLVALIERHRDDVVMGRTLLQLAVPMRFAWRVARWLDPLLDALEEFDAALLHLPLQLGGPVGDLSPFGESFDQVAESVAEELRLVVPTVSWHTDRGPVLRVTSLVQRTVTAAASIAADLVLLAQREIGEVELPGGGSSSMPHKRNPMLAVRAVAAARACHGVATVITGAPPHELERAAGSWHAEWFALPLVFHTASAVLEATRDAVAGVTFNVTRALTNIPHAEYRDFSVSDRLVARVLERRLRLAGHPG